MHVVAGSSGTVTKADFARMAKVTRAAVSIALSKGRITAERDHSMDPKRPENAAYLTTRKRQRRQKSPGPGRKSKGIPEQAPPKSKAGREGKPAGKADARRGRKKGRAEIAEKGPHKGALEIGGETYNMADLRHTIAKADKAEQEIAIRRGELVERADVHRVFAHLYQIHSSQLKTLADKLGPDVAAAFKLTDADTPRVQELMSLEVRRSLAQIKKEMNEYLDGIGDGAVAD